MWVIRWLVWITGLAIYFTAWSRSAARLENRERTALIVGRGPAIAWALLSFAALVPATAFPERALQSYPYGLLIDVLTYGAMTAIALAARPKEEPCRPMGENAFRRMVRWRWALLSAIFGQMALALSGPSAPL